MSDLSLAEVLETVKDIAHQAGAVLREAANKPRQVNYKGTVDLVTETDKAVEELIVDRIRDAYPHHAIVGEEGTDINPESHLRWLIDPIDGTTNFAHGFPFYSTSIALCDAESSLVGVVYDATRDEMFSAVKGQGAYLNDEPINAAPVDHLLQALLVTGFPYYRQTADDNNIKAMDTFVRKAQGVRRAGSAALELCYIGCGRLDGYWEMSMNPWDIAAGMLVLHEAGGIVTGYLGDGSADLLAGPNNIAAAATTPLHTEMVSVLASIYQT